MRVFIAALVSFVVAAPVTAQVYLGHGDIVAERPESEVTDGTVPATFGFGRAVVRIDDQLIVGAEIADFGSYTVIAYRRVGGRWDEFQRFENAGGTALARVGDALAIGAHTDEVDGLANAGAVKLFAFDADADAWVLSETLVDPQPAPNAYFGQTLAAVGDTLFVGAPHAEAATVYGVANEEAQGALGGRVYAFRGGSVVQTLTGDVDAGGAAFGAALAATDERLVIGAPGEGLPALSGTVYWYDLAAGTATRAGRMENPSADGRESPFGHAVSVAGDTLLTGATALMIDDTVGHGAAHLFRLSPAGAEYITTLSGDGRFGWSVLLLNGSQALIGAPAVSEVLHYADVGGVWTAVQRIAEPVQTTFRDGYFGETLTLSAGELFIGAPSALHDAGASDGSRVPQPSFTQGGKLYEVPLVAAPLADLSLSVSPTPVVRTGTRVEMAFHITGDSSEPVSAAFVTLRTHLEPTTVPDGCSALRPVAFRCELGAIGAGETADFVVSFAAPAATYHHPTVDGYVGSELADPITPDNLATGTISVLTESSELPPADGGGGALGWLSALFLLAMLKSRIRLRRSAPCSARTCGLPDSIPTSR